ncbi:MAG: tRNA pseudouridine(55) synthase TruB [Thermotaleaceae bacterium]
MDGILNILKPPGMTSHDVVGWIRKVLKTKKVGHTGTLDPMAAGVLPICIGSATKISQYLLNDRKSYRCEMTLGSNTDTQDKWGKVTEAHKVDVSQEDIFKAFNQFKGDIFQMPPMYSALKHQGKKLYELAREGKVVEREPRKIRIYDLDIIRIDGNKVLFDVCCSKGTYVRTLCEDIGNHLNCGAHMSFLLRTASGCFKLDETVCIEELEKESLETISEQYLFPLDYPLRKMSKVIVKEDSLKYLLNGNNLFLRNIACHDSLKLGEQVRIYADKNFLAIGTVKKEQNIYIDVSRVFN